MSRWHEFLRCQCKAQSDDWRFARNAVATYFGSCKSPEHGAPAAFSWGAFQQTRRYQAVIAAASLLPYLLDQRQMPQLAKSAAWQMLEGMS